MTRRVSKTKHAIYPYEDWPEPPMQRYRVYDPRMYDPDPDPIAITTLIVLCIIGGTAATVTNPGIWNTILATVFPQFAEQAEAERKNMQELMSKIMVVIVVVAIIGIIYLLWRHQEHKKRYRVR